MQQRLNEHRSKPTLDSTFRHRIKSQPEMGIYRDNLSAITFYRLSLSLKIVWIYRLPLSLLLYILLSPIYYRDKRFFMHAVLKLQS